MSQSITDEIHELLDGWITNHPRYGIIQQALWDNHLTHAMIFLGSDGCVYQVDQIDGVSAEHTNTIKAHYADPKFLDQVSALLDSHITSCGSCQALLLRISI
jgi:uncharacterized protein CbrC (UPF0167 family)